MLLDSSSATEPLSRNQSSPPGIVKVRIRFRKAGPLRLVSHHDLMHCFERMFRRANLPFRSTQGFHPQPKIVFALSLALGVIGCEEVVEVELDQPIDPDEIHRRLTQQCPPGLEILSVRQIDLKTKAHVVRVGYQVALPAERLCELPDRITKVLNQTEFWVDRTRPKPRRFNLRPFIDELALAGDRLEMALWVGNYGMARPEEILMALGLGDLFEAGLVLERTKLELLDEQPSITARRPRLEPEGPEPRLPGETEKRKPSHPSALLPGPLSFDS